MHQLLSEYHGAPWPMALLLLWPADLILSHLLPIKDFRKGRRISSRVITTLYIETCDLLPQLRYDQKR